MNMQEKNDVIEIDLLEVFGLLLNKIWFIGICGAIASIVAFAVSAFVIAPKYESTTSIYIMSRQNDQTLSYSDTQLSSQLTKDYQKLISSRYVYESVIEGCSLDEEYDDLKSRVTINSVTDTRIINITVKDKDPALAQYVANSIREVASEHIKNVTDVEAVNVVDMANLPKEPSEPSVFRWTLIGLLLGIFVSVAIVVIRYLADDTIKSADDVERYLGWSTLALIPSFEEDTSNKKESKKKSDRKKEDKSK